MAIETERILATALNASGMSELLHLHAADIARPFALARAQPRDTQGHVSVSYLAEAFDKYDSHMLHAALARPGLLQLMRHFGYDVLYRQWLDAQVKVDVWARKNGALFVGDAAIEALKAYRSRIVEELAKEMQGTLKHQRAALYGFAGG